jgi:cytochrome c
MKTASFIYLVCAGISLSASGVALGNEELSRKNGCGACHTSGKKIVGPAWQDVAAKYKSDAKAAEALSAKVRAGGKGVWGNIPMPAQTKVSDADLKAILGWVLAL